MRVGILTFHQSANYGATLQAYALWKAVQDLGHDAEIIDYAPWRSSLEYWKCVVKSKRMPARASQYLKIKNFIHTKTKVSHRTYRTSQSLKTNKLPYDIVLCGSDEIWNIHKPYIGLDPAYFLSFIDGCFNRKASYAASFGETQELNGRRQEISGLLDSFESIGVRDSNSARLVFECGQRAVKVLDPAFLISYAEEESVRPFEKEYLLLYGYQLSPEQNHFIKRIAAAKNLPIVSIGNHNPVAEHNRISVSPGEWVNFYKHASHVVTSYYHGIIFSILYRKQFNVLTKANKMIKMDDLLCDLDLSRRIFQGSLSEKGLYDEIDYSSVSKKVAELTLTSKDFLAACLITNAESYA